MPGGEPDGAGHHDHEPAGPADHDGDELDRLRSRLAAAHRVLSERDDRIQELTSELAALRGLQGSTALAVAGATRRGVIRLLPAGTRRTRAVGYLLAVAHGANRGRQGPPASPPPKSEATRYIAEPAVLAAEYRKWREHNEPGPAELDRLRRANASWTERPLVSVILPVADGDARWMDDSIDSVEGQVYDAWELRIVADVRGTDAASALEKRAAADDRISIIPAEPVGDRSVAVQRGVVQALGAWVIRLVPGDQLRPDALHRIVEHANLHRQDDTIYGDEDRLSPSGARERPEFKPDWSPDYLLARDYLGPSTAIRRSLLEDVGGWQAGDLATQDHDLHLRVTERACGVGHVPAVLVTRRDGVHRAGGVPASSDNPVASALVRRRQTGRAVARPDGRYDVHFELEGRPSVEIIIPTRDRVDLLRACVDSITQRSTYPSYRITVVDNDSVEEATLRFLQRDDLTVVRGEGPFNFSRLVNAGVRASEAEYVLLLNNDITVITPEWIEAMLELGQQPGVGAVGCRLLFPDGSVQHEGVALIPEYIAANASWPWPVIRNVSAVTAACMLVRRDVYWSIDGFDEAMGVVFNDVDFCLRMMASGRRVLYTPYAELEHDESSSRGASNPPGDIDLFFSRWGTPDRLRDPFVSPHVLWPHPQRLRTAPAGSEYPG